MRIGFLSTDVSSGGAARAMQRTIAALNALGHETVLITHRPGGDSAAPVIEVQDNTTGQASRRAGVAHYFYNGRYVAQNRSDLSNTTFWIPAVGLDLTEVVSPLDLDVLNIHWTAHFLSLRSLDGLMRLPAPVVFTLHDMGDFTGGCHYAAGCRRFERSCRPCPQLRFDPLSVPADVRASRSKLYAAHKPWAIGPSQWITDLAAASGMFEAERCARIGNALDTGAFAPQPRRRARKSFGLDPAARVILFGAFDNSEHRKGFDLLVEAVRRLAAERAGGPLLTVLGLGANLPALEIEGVEVVEAGYIDNDRRLAEAYSASDVVALASREDNQPNVLVEALSCGTPVAGFAVGGIAEMIEDGVNGALAEPGDPASLADAIRRVLGGDRTRMGRAARQSAVVAANPEIHAARYVDIFEAAREARGLGASSGCGSGQGRASTPDVQYAEALVEYFGGLPAEAAIRLRARMK